MSHPADSNGGATTPVQSDTGVGGGQPSVEEIEADIARTREQLAETVDALAGRLDVKSRVRGRVEQTKQDAAHRVGVVKERATGADGKPTPPVLAGAAAALVVVVLVVWWRSR